MEFPLLVVTLIALTVSVAMSVVAWRIVRRERQRSNARVAALQTSLFGASPDTLAESAAGSVFLSEAISPVGPERRLLPLVAGTAVVLVLVGAAAVSWTSRLAHSRPAPATTNVRSERPAVIELVALTHEREGDRIVLRGAVRNPEGGTALDGVTATVTLYGRAGGLVTKARTDVSSPTLAPGSEANFQVAVPAAGVVRYRISFQSGTQAVSHIDRRLHG
jgi:hypothetical protein